MSDWLWIGKESKFSVFFGIGKGVTDLEGMKVCLVDLVDNRNRSDCPNGAEAPRTYLLNVKLVVNPCDNRNQVN